MASSTLQSRQKDNGALPATKTGGSAEGQLKGPVLDVFTRLIPEIASLPRDKAFETILRSPALLDGCFQIFKTHPDLFAEMLVDRHQTPVLDHDKPLSCGQTLNEVTSMVVRGCAKRYFRQHLDPPRRKPRPPKPLSPWQQFLRLFRPAPPAPPRPPTPAEKLFRVIRSYLLYDWQVPMIPHYTPLPVATVHKLGARLLEAHNQAQLQALLRGESPDQVARHIGAPAKDKAAAAGQSPLFGGISGSIGRPEDVLISGGLDPEAAWRVWQRFEGGKLFGNPRAELQQAALAIVCKCNPELLSSLFYVAGLDTRQVLILLVVVLRKIGEPPFMALMGPTAPAARLNGLVTRLSSDGLPQETDPVRIHTRMEEIVAAYLKDRNDQLD